MTDTPSTNTWAAGPDISGSLNGHAANFGADDAPAAILPNGHVIFAADAGPNPVVVTGNITNGSSVVTHVSSTALLYPGWAASGTGIPSVALISPVDSSSQITLNTIATTTATGVSLTMGGIFSNPTELFDFNPSNNTISPLSPALSADTNLSQLPAFTSRLLVLPNGQLLYSDGTSSQLYIYTSDAFTVPAALRPVVNGVAYNGNSTFTLTGKQLNGQNAGAAYGDDVASDSNYPIVRLQTSPTGGTVYYCTATNWSSTGVGGGISSLAQTVQFTLNPSMKPGNYFLIVSGAGIQSTPMVMNITASELPAR